MTADNDKKFSFTDVSMRNSTPVVIGHTSATRCLFRVWIERKRKKREMEKRKPKCIRKNETEKGKRN